MSKLFILTVARAASYIFLSAQPILSNENCGSSKVINLVDEKTSYSQSALHLIQFIPGMNYSENAIKITEFIPNNSYANTAIHLTSFIPGVHISSNK